MMFKSSDETLQSPLLWIVGWLYRLQITLLGLVIIYVVYAHLAHGAVSGTPGAYGYQLNDTWFDMSALAFIAIIISCGPTVWLGVRMMRRRKLYRQICWLWLLAALAWGGWLLAYTTINFGSGA